MQDNKIIAKKENLKGVIRFTSTKDEVLLKVFVGNDKFKRRLDEDTFLTLLSPENVKKPVVLSTGIKPDNNRGYNAMQSLMVSYDGNGKIIFFEGKDYEPIKSKEDISNSYEFQFDKNLVENMYKYAKYAKVTKSEFSDAVQFKKQVNEDMSLDDLMK